ncbi:hypothetical protein N7541_006390 [Penicillium brevicompactum]|uniref:Uncharacterized protein n=1 Tax=Penicillium brevicompactum TaxID=5074 RepID=A0A9W9R5B5_PENBR|nr:uncharacterized protein N7506_011950 [Penicillium brevicompactum]KAJ5319246.1 hypothetical protein N7506_011950 [Penicillium brevicompactum]KAJ5322824.1 hypothetical protein N7452_011113 [Penicillium brevicompactum]KAJ5353826.1 hypothetical protein N7541_006390 [Penicillium brevicompactum]
MQHPSSFRANFVGTITPSLTSNPRSFPLTTAKMFRATSSRMAGFVFRENRVPYYQRLFQNHDGKRQWWKTSRSGYIMWPYLITTYTLGAASMYGMCRMVLGKKTWY